MPNVNRQDLEALRNMVSQAHLIVSTEPLIVAESSGCASC
jgi:hypothetical protein